MRQYVDLPQKQIGPLPSPGTPTPGKACVLPSGSRAPYCGADLVAWVEDSVLPILRLADCDRAILRCLDLHREDGDARTECVAGLTRDYCARR